MLKDGESFLIWKQSFQKEDASRLLVVRWLKQDIIQLHQWASDRMYFCRYLHVYWVLDDRRQLCLSFWVIAGHKLDSLFRSVSWLDSSSLSDGVWWTVPRIAVLCRGTSRPTIRWKCYLPECDRKIISDPSINDHLGFIGRWKSGRFVGNFLRVPFYAICRTIVVFIVRLIKDDKIKKNQERLIE